jgi:signal transduction histidine kinase
VYFDYEDQLMITADSSSQQYSRKSNDDPKHAKSLAVHERRPTHSRESLVGFEQKVLAALEREQARIARELHDDISQRITLLIWESRGMDQSPPPTGQEESQRKSRGWLTEQLQKLANDIQTIAHRMHPSHLEYLGLAAAADILCRDLAAKHQVEINLRCDGIRRDLSKDISLCLYRVLQEGLQNAIKHSGVQQFSVGLFGTRSVVRLIIMDNGVGFDAGQAEKRHGLGLISMRERMRLVHGAISLKSTPGQGTTIRCRVRTGIAHS